MGARRSDLFAGGAGSLLVRLAGERAWCAEDGAIFVDGIVAFCQGSELFLRVWSCDGVFVTYVTTRVPNPTLTSRCIIVAFMTMRVSLSMSSTSPPVRD